MAPHQLFFSSLGLVAISFVFSAATASPLLGFVTNPENDFYTAAAAQLNRTGLARVQIYGNAHAALNDGPAGLLLLASGYPDSGTPFDDETLNEATSAGVRIFIEFPAWVPKPLATHGTSVTSWRRVVTNSTDFFAASEALAERGHLLTMFKSATYLPITGALSSDEHLLLAKVAGFENATLGPSDPSDPLLLQHPNRSHQLLLASSKISDARTRRFAPPADWSGVLSAVLGFLLPQADPKQLLLSWDPPVHPTYAKEPQHPLPAGAARDAALRAVLWYRWSGLMPSYARLAEVAAACAALGDTENKCSGLPPSPTPSDGNGQLGIFEGFSSDIGADGANAQSLSVRNDCVSEVSSAFAVSSVLRRQQQQRGAAEDARTATNLLEYTYSHSGLPQPWQPPDGRDNATFGLLGWTTAAEASELFYKDDNARSLLAAVLTSGLLGKERWHTRITTAVLANLRFTGTSGFGPGALTFSQARENGWASYYNHDYSDDDTSYSPHYQSYIWAVYLWAYDRSGFAPLLERAQAAITKMMEQYPQRWIPTSNGVTVQRARMLLPLAWLVRVNGTDLHRGWLREVADGLIERQDAEGGCFREEVTAEGWGGETRIPTNEDYGTFEAPLNQANTDPVCDLLYTQNFAFLGLHEAAAAAAAAAGGAEDADAQVYRDAADRLASFFVRAQMSSTEHPELDGAFYRGFDFGRWEVWASDADLGWGAWSVETGWTQGWIANVLGMRELSTSMWDVGQKLEIAEEFEQWTPYFFPAEKEKEARATGAYAESVKRGAAHMPPLTCGAAARGAGAPLI